MAVFDYNIVKDPRVFCENRLPAHSDHKFYASKQEALAGKSSFVYSLNGLWKFSYAENYESAVSGFEKADYDCKDWADIRVPAHIQLEGYDTPQYVNTQYPWDGREEIRPGEIPSHFNPTASYVKYFRISEAMKGQRVFVCFEGAESGLALWLNGQYVGYSEDSFTPSEFELTPYLRDGENKLAVQVFKWTAGSWCEDQDFYRFSGLYRDVYLYTVPEVHVQDLCIRTQLDDAYENAVLEIDAQIAGCGRVQYCLMDGAQTICEWESEVKSGCAAGDGANHAGETAHVADDGANHAGETAHVADDGANHAGETAHVAGDDADHARETAHVAEDGVELAENSKRVGDLSADTRVQTAAKVTHPQLWSAEFPKLYELWITLYNEAGEAVEVIRQMVGFRRFEMKDTMMHLNGKRIVFKGVNRHDFSSLHGRAVTYEETERDIITMKRNNINAVRTSHYPNHSFLYELCDRYGLYVMDETNLESHGSWQPYEGGRVDRDFVVPGSHPEWLGAMLDRANSMYQRDKNHASILIWSCGNESFGGSVIYEMAQQFRRQDATRLVHYEGVFHDRSYPDTSDMESQMYTPAAQIEEFLKKDRSKPFICCEYLHAMGNSCGAMHKYTDLTDTEPLYQGGFIWDYIDQSLTAKNRYGEEFEAYGGDFGERPTDYNFSGNGIAYGGPDREESPKMATVKYHYQNIQIVPSENEVLIKNKNLFTNTNVYDCVATLERGGHLICREVLSVSAEPLSQVQIELPFGRAQEPGEYAVTVSFYLKEDTLWAKRGHEVAFGQYIYEVTPQAEAHGRADESNTVCANARGCAGVEDTAPLTMQAAEVDDLQIIRGHYNVGVRGTDFDVLFSYEKGLVSYRYGGRELVRGIPRPEFWRAPIDNDNGCGMAQRYAQWKLASLYAKIKGMEVVEPKPAVNGTEQSGESSEYAVSGAEGAVEGRKCAAPDAAQTGQRSEGTVENGSVTVVYTYELPTTPQADCRLAYTVYGDGTVNVKLSYDPVRELAAPPLFGWTMKLDADYDKLEWYGFGPQETYSDRQAGTKLGIYRSSAAESMARYLVPQECGNHTGVRWAKVTDRRGRGLLFSGAAIDFSALPYTAHELEAAAHPHELPRVHYTVVRTALGQMGVGGDDSWGARPHEEYLLKTDEKMQFSFSFKGI